MSLIAQVVVLDRPSSFRNRYDSKNWRKQLQDAEAARSAAEIQLFGVAANAHPVSNALSAEIYHFFAQEDSIKDTDNMAKPVLDAFNTVIYNDDKQIRSLRFESLQFFSQGAENLLSVDPLLRALLQGPFLKIRSGSIGNDCTIVIFRNIDSLNLVSSSPRFLAWNTEYMQGRVG